jgi:DNA-binding NarL/FixJ family response regulator
VKGGTLVVSRAINLHSHYKQRFETLGFSNVSITALDKDALFSLIRQTKPGLVFLGAGFFHSTTPYRVRELLCTFRKLNLAVISLDNYPPDLGRACIQNGAKSYIWAWDGLAELYKGIEIVREGGNYISPAVKECIAMRRDYAMPAKLLTDRQCEIARLLGCGFTEHEIADTLHISRNTVVTQKSNI